MEEKTKINISECSLFALKCQDRHTRNLVSTCSKSQIISKFGKILITPNMQVYKIRRTILCRR